MENDCPQCGEPDVVVEGFTICFGCMHDNEEEAFERGEG